MIEVDKTLLPSDRIWRYLTLPAYLDLLHRKALYFSSIEALQRIDPWEGTLWPIQLDRQTADLDYDEPLRKAYRQGYEFGLQHGTFVCCWHQNPSESAAMWDLYSNQNGVAIDSTVGSLCQSMGQLLKVIIYPMNYFSTEENVDTDVAYRKRDSFRHEQEVRVQVVQNKASKPGVHVPVDIARLVNRVYVNPKADPWIAEVVRNVTKTLGLTFIIEHSPLYKPR